MPHQQLLSAYWPCTFHLYNDTYVYSTKSTILDPMDRSGIPIHAVLKYGTTLYSSAWTNWEFDSYRWKFELYTGFQFNPARNFKLTPTPFDETAAMYKAYCQHFFTQLKKQIGSSCVQREKRFTFDNGIYLEYDSVIKGDSEYGLFVNFSKISDKKRVKLHKNTQSIHKTGATITTEKFFEMLQSDIDQGYKVVLDKFEQNLKT